MHSRVINSRKTLAFTTNIGTLCDNFTLVTVMMHSCVELMMIERVEREGIELMMNRTNKIEIN